MNKEQFWQIIDKVNEGAPFPDEQTHLNKLYEELGRLTDRDLIDWHLIKEQYSQAAYRNDLWAASNALGAHASDDGFIDFRSWLISRGKAVYMNALQDPDSLADVPFHGEDLNFESFGYAASHVYETKEIRDNQIMPDDFYSTLGNYTLSPDTLAELQSELPHRKDIGSKWTLEMFPRLFQKIHARKKEEHTERNSLGKMFQELIESPRQIHAHIYDGKSHGEYLFENTAENIANFLGAHPGADKILLTDPLDRPILSAMGNFIDRCPDQVLLEQIKEVLIPIQLGEREPHPIFCPSIYEVTDYCLYQNGLKAQIQEQTTETMWTVHLRQDGVYQMFESDIPRELFRGATPSIVEYLEYGDLEDMKARIPALLQPGDQYHMCFLNKTGEEQYCIAIIWGATHITEYVCEGRPVCEGAIEEITDRLRGIQCTEQSDPQLDPMIW